MPEREPLGLSRRQLLAATVGGALLRSAWGLALGETATGDERPGVTVAWNPDGFAALVEHRRRRVLLLDCPNPQLQAALTETVTGFLRQRIDILLAPDATLRTLPTGMRDRWKLSSIMAVDSDTDHPQIGLAGRRINVGELSIGCHRTDARAWRADGDPLRGWCLDVRNRAGQLLLVPSATVARHVPPSAELATVMLVADDELGGLPLTLSGTVLAAPSDAPVFDEADGHTSRAIRLFCDSPVTFTLSTTGLSCHPAEDAQRAPPLPSFDPSRC